MQSEPMTKIVALEFISEACRNWDLQPLSDDDIRDFANAFNSHTRAALSERDALKAEIERLRGALNDAAEVIESCSAVFLRKWGTTNKWRNAVLATALAALAGKAEQ